MRKLALLLTSLLISCTEAPEKPSTVVLTVNSPPTVETVIAAPEYDSVLVGWVERAW